MLKTLLHSYQKVGGEEDFHVFSDQEIPGAIHHPIQDFDKSFFHFKFAFMQIVKRWDYDYFIFLDADNYFVRKPVGLLDLVKNSPLHCFLESDCSLPCKRKQWHCCPLPTYVRMMHDCGVTSRSCYTVNAGFFIVQREAIDTVCGLCMDFWKFAAEKGYLFTEEAPLSYATEMLCRDPVEHLLQTHPNIWATDWTRIYGERWPDGEEWLFTDYLDHTRFPVNPAIVHMLKSKERLIEFGKSLSAN